MIGLEGLIDKINGANSVRVLYNVRDPGSFSAASALSSFKNKKISIGSINRSGISTRKKWIMPKDYDLVLFVGIHGIPDGISRRKEVIRLDDSFSLSTLRNENIYPVNKKNCIKSKTTSYAETAYRILQENDIETDKYLDLLLIIGDYDDNPELGMTSFQKELMEKNNLSSSINLVDRLEEYKIFDYLPFSTFYDYNEYIDFNYKIHTEMVDGHERGYIKNRINMNEFIDNFNLNSNKLSDKLYDMFKEQRVPQRIKNTTGIEHPIEDLFNYPSFKSYSIEELLLGLDRFLAYVKRINSRNLLRDPRKPFFWNNKIDNFISASYNPIKKTIKNEILAYLDSNTKLNMVKRKKFNFISIDNNAGNFGGKWTWFPFFRWGSVLLEYEYNKYRDISYGMFYSKSKIHSGVLSLIYSKELRSVGGGEFFKAFFNVHGNIEENYTNKKDFKTNILHILKDINDTKAYLPSLDHYLLYYSMVHGTPTALIVDKEHYTLYNCCTYPKYTNDQNTFNEFTRKYENPIIVNYQMLKNSSPLNQHEF